MASERTVRLRYLIRTEVKLIAVWISFLFCFLDSKLHLGQRWKALSPPEVEDYWQFYGPHTFLGGIVVVMGQSTFCGLHTDMWSVGSSSSLEASLIWKIYKHLQNIRYYHHTSSFTVIFNGHCLYGLDDRIHSDFFIWISFPPDLFKHCLQVTLLATNSAFWTDSRVIFVVSLKPWQ